jgi:hypothetical protein
MTQQIADARPRRSKPFAKITLNPTLLRFSLGAIRSYHLKRGERVDIIWDRHSEIWDCPVMIIKRGGTQRLMSGNKGFAPATSMKVAIGTAVNQFDIPLPETRLPILDYVNGEIWVDFSIGSEPEPKQKGEVKSERLSIDFGSADRIAVRWGKEYKRVIKSIAEQEGITLNTLIIREMDRFIEDRYPEVWQHLLKFISRPPVEGGRMPWKGSEYEPE